MAEVERPTIGNGKICYLEIPATDPKASSEFYRKVFGWNIRTRGDGSVSFDDGVGEVSGSWRTDRRPATEMGTLVHIMVDDAVATIVSVKAHGGTIVQEIGGDAPEITAHFRDPVGNMFGIYQHRSG
jgi:predicted enzyme related to lactoylglutathione lyase